MYKSAPLFTVYTACKTMCYSCTFASHTIPIVLTCLLNPLQICFCCSAEMKNYINQAMKNSIFLRWRWNLVKILNFIRMRLSRGKNTFLNILSLTLTIELFILFFSILWRLICNCGGLRMQWYGSGPVGLGPRGQIKQYQICGINNSNNWSKLELAWSFKPSYYAKMK